MLKASLWSVMIPVLGVPLGVYTLLAVLLFVFQEKLVYFPDRQIAATPRDLGLAYDDVRFAAEDGVQLAGWFIPGRSARALLFCHGNAGNISHRLESIAIFNRLGLSTFIFDYRGYGESRGKPSEQGTYRDARAAWDYLVREKGFAPERIVVFGRSLGGAVAAHLAMTQKPAALILESTFSSLPDLGARLYPWFPVRLLARIRCSTVDYVRRVGCPVLVVHSRHDDIVPFDLGLAVFRAAGEPRELLEIEGDHNSGFLVSGERYAAGLKAFMDRHLDR